MQSDAVCTPRVQMCADAVHFIMDRERLPSMLIVLCHIRRRPYCVWKLTMSFLIVIRNTVAPHIPLAPVLTSTSASWASPSPLYVVSTACLHLVLCMSSFRRHLVAAAVLG
jgi:hypothetical protein